MIVLDTNVLSESFNPSPSPVVFSWLAAQDPQDLFTTVITQAEMLIGIELLPEGKRKAKLLDAIEKFFAEDLQTDILSFDEEAARAFAKLTAQQTRRGRPISQFDAMIAAIALANGATVATRDVDGFEGCGIEVVNPWSE